MKKTFLLLCLVVFYYTMQAQCDKNITFKSELARQLGGENDGKEIPIEATLKFENNKVEFNLLIQGTAVVISGNIGKVTLCDWTAYLKNGKTEMKVNASKDGEAPEDTIIVIESKNGKTTLTIGGDPNDGNKLQFDISEYTVEG